MYSLLRPPQQQYDHIPASETSSDTETVTEKSPSVPTRRSCWTVARSAGLTFAAVLGVAVVFILGYTWGSEQTARPSVESTKTLVGNCTEPYFRKEWRSLSNDEKTDYLEAFQCFIDSPSVLGMNGSLHDDFSWVHNLIAHSTHSKAPFLSWHRRFIFVYEKYLQNSCGYKGALPFWDWSLDWEDFPESPIFDSKLGFGGDGDPKAPMHQSSHCVTDLPFKNLKPKWYGSEYEPHCLTRSFSEDWYGNYLNPAALDKVMSSVDYAEFFLALERGPHDIIPMGIRGDFTSFTAPNDPIFYLHHSQLDRVWWLWQLRDKRNRVRDYGGIGDNDKNVTLTDNLPLAGLDQDLKVADIMDTEGGDMCYRYMYS